MKPLLPQPILDILNNRVMPEPSAMTPAAYDESQHYLLKKFPKKPPKKRHNMVSRYLSTVSPGTYSRRRCL